MCKSAQVSISGFLPESTFLEFLNFCGVEILKGGIKEVDLEKARQSNPSEVLHSANLKQVIIGRYLVRYLGKKFALSYFYESTSQVDTERFEFTSIQESLNFNLSRTYIDALTHEVILDLLQKLAFHFDAYFDEGAETFKDRHFHKLNSLIV
jgi:hypothetical protein